MKKIFSFIEKHEVLIVILCAVALLRLPGLFEPNRYADEDIYLTIGQGVGQGRVLYSEIFDNKTPLIYLTAMMAGGVMGFRLILMIWNLVNVVLIWKLGEKLIEKKWGVILATALFAIFSTAPLLEGEIANGEIFMIMPATAALYLFISKKYFLSGILWAVAFLFKVPVAFELFGVIFFMTLSLRIFDRRLWLMLLGFGLPIVASLIYFFWAGAGEMYVRSALLQNISYLSSWGGGGGSGSLLSGGLTTRALALFACLGAIWALRKKIGDKFALAAIWLVTALFGALLSGRPYPHYLIEIVGPAAILTAMTFSEKAFYTAVLWVASMGLLVAAIVKYDFWYYKSWPYYQNFIDYVRGAKTKDQYYEFWGKGVLANYQAARYISQVTSEGEEIFVWGTEPAIYALSKRQPVGKYTVAYHILDFSAAEETLELLENEKPRIIAVVTNEKGAFPGLASLLAANYIPVKDFEGLRIYLKIIR